jgi:branched-chain amino acid transport system permease protein
MDANGPFLQLAATGVTIGAIYALIGLGLTLVYTTTRVINVAAGDFAMAGALTAASLAAADVPLAGTYAAAAVVGAAVGLLTYTLAIRPAQRRDASVLTLLIVTIGVHLALVGVAAIIWGTSAYNLPPITPGAPVDLLSARVTRQSLWILLTSAALLAILWTFFSRSLRGKALRACAVNPLGARLSGIPVGRMGALAFTLSAVLAALAGVLLTPQTLATYDMGLPLSLAAFVGAAIGRLVSYPVTVAGCLLLGLLESFAAGLLPSGYRDAVAFVLLIAILLWRALPALRHGVIAAEESARA